MGKKEWLRPREVAEILNCSYETVLEIIRRGDLRVVRLGKSPNAGIRIKPEDFEAFLKRHKDAGKTKARR